MDTYLGEILSEQPTNQPAPTPQPTSPGVRKLPLQMSCVVDVLWGTLGVPLGVPPGYSWVWIASKDSVGLLAQAGKQHMRVTKTKLARHVIKP